MGSQGQPGRPVAPPVPHAGTGRAHGQLHLHPEPALQLVHLRVARAVHVVALLWLWWLLLRVGVACGVVLVVVL